MDPNQMESSIEALNHRTEETKEADPASADPNDSGVVQNPRTTSDGTTNPNLSGMTNSTSQRVKTTSTAQSQVMTSLGNLTRPGVPREYRLRFCNK